MANIEPRELLLVDDSEVDVALLTRAFAKAGTKHPLVRFTDGQEAIHHLQAVLRPDAGDRPALPAAILTDLKMPRVDGFELLTWIRSQPMLAEVIAVVLTGSNLEEDVERAYRCGATFFLTKPSDLRDLENLASSFVEWIEKGPASQGFVHRASQHPPPFVRRWH